MEQKKLLAAIALLVVVLFMGCKKDDYVETIGVCPVVISTIPSNGATGVPLNQIITATFNEKEMNPATITQASFTVGGATLISGIVTYSGSTVSFAPSSALLPNTTYTCTITTSVRDLNGNPLQTNYVWTFNTDLSPTVILMDPICNATGVATDKTINTTFSVPMNASTINTTTYTLKQGDTPITGIVTYIGNVASFKPNSALLPNTTYTVSITTGAKNLAGTSLAVNYSCSFTTIPQVTLSSNPVTGGTTNGAGYFANGTSVTVTATPNTGYTFTNWTEGTNVVSTNPGYTFTMNGNRTLVANFTVVVTKYIVNLSSNPFLSGATTGGGSYESGTLVAVSATPNAGYKFTNWTEGIIVVSSSANYSFSITGNRTLIANFTADPIKYTVSLSSSPLAGGTTTGGGSYNSGASVSIAATANSGYTFTNWTEGLNVVSSSANYTFNINSNRTLVANFTLVPPTQFSVNLTSNPLAGGLTTGGGSFNSEASVSIAATANSGYTFTNWTEGLNVVSSSANYTFNINSNRTLVANFTLVPPTQFSVNLSSNPLNGGTTTGGGSFNSGASVSIAATANSGYTFTNWTEGANIVSTNANYTFTISSNRVLVANFSATQYNVTLSSNPLTGGSTTGGGSFNSGASVSIAATANSGYTFTNWTEGANIVSTNANYTFTISSNRVLVANFSAIKYNVTLSSNPLAGGSTTGGGSFNSGASVSIAATANSGYTFTNWTEGANIVSTNANYTFTISSNRVLVANFTLAPPVGPIVNLGTAANFEILTKTGISTTGVTSITGDIGVSPIAATGITGFGLIMDTNGETSHTPIVIGKVYASDYAPPTPSKLTVAVSDMETAFTTANNLVVPAPIVSLGAGDISGLVLAPGLYKWGTGVLISSAGVTLNGGPNDTWVFQIAQDLTVNNSAIVHLTGGAQAKNIYWVVTGKATLGTDVIFNGNILCKTLISLNTGAKITGRLLAQTAVTLNASTVIKP